MFAELDEEQKELVQTELGDAYKNENFNQASMKAIADYLAGRVEQ